MVLDIGKEERVHADTEFLLYRGDDLVGKARITAVNKTSSVAELLPGFTVKMPEPGDLAVLAGAEKM